MTFDKGIKQKQNLNKWTNGLHDTRKGFSVFQYVISIFTVEGEYNVWDSMGQIIKKKLDQLNSQTDSRQI